LFLLNFTLHNCLKSLLLAFYKRSFIRPVLIGLLLSFNITLFSQNIRTQQRLDSLKLQFQKDSSRIYRFQKFRFRVALDRRNSWIKNQRATKQIPVSINGFQLGAVLFEKHSVGFGLYNIAAESKRPAKINDQLNTIRYEELFMNYFTGYYEYVLLNKRFFEIDIPVELGLGRYVYNLKDETQTKLLWHEQGPIKLSSAGLQVIFKPLKWIGLVGMGGYRFVRFNEKTNLNFNNFYYSYGVWVDIRQIHRDLRFYAFKRPKYRKKVKAILASEP